MLSGRYFRTCLIGVFAGSASFEVQEIGEIDALLVAARPAFVHVMEVGLSRVVLAGVCWERIYYIILTKLLKYSSLLAGEIS